MEVDLAIVGGGPAGSAAAVTAARAGASVLVVDKASFPRDKCCGDGLTTLALRLGEELGLDPGAIAGWQVVDGAVLHGPSGRTVRFPLPRGDGQYAVVVPRREYDAALLDLAQRAGANVRVGHAMVEIKVDAKGATLAVDGMGEVRATTVVAADGMWSPTRRLLRLADEGYRGEWHAFRQYVADVRRRPTSTSGSNPTCCPATPGRSPCPVVGPTWASGCSGEGRSPWATPGDCGMGSWTDRPSGRFWVPRPGQWGVAWPGPSRPGWARRHWTMDRSCSPGTPRRSLTP